MCQIRKSEKKKSQVNANEKKMSLEAIKIRKKEIGLEKKGWKKKIEERRIEKIPKKMSGIPKKKKWREETKKNTKKKERY